MELRQCVNLIYFLEIMFVQLRKVFIVFFQFDVFKGDDTQSPQRLQLVIAKEDWVGREADNE